MLSLGYFLLSLFFVFVRTPSKSGFLFLLRDKSHQSFLKYFQLLLLEGSYHS